GNMATNNVMQIRMMPPAATTASKQSAGPHLVRASYDPEQTPAAGDSGFIATLTNLLEGMLGYSQGRGAQALGQVPVVSQSAPPAPKTVLAGNVKQTSGAVSVIRAGTTTPVPLNVGDNISMGDTIITGPESRVYLFFQDNTEMTLGENTKIAIDDYLFDPSGAHSNHAQYR